MKNWKKYAALAGAAALLIIFCLPMVFALKGDFSINLFMASLFAVLFAAVMAYVMLMLCRHLNKKGKTETPQTGIRNIIFDVGMVLVDFDWQSYLKTFGFPQDTFDRIAAATFKSPVWDERDRGLLTEEEYVNQMAALDPELEQDIRRVMEHSEKTITHMPYAKTWAKYLKSKGYRLYILSNYCSMFCERTRKTEMPFLRYMDGAVFSCEIHQIKPETAAYEAVLSQYGLVPQECVFIDDREENCASAERLGIKAIRFKSFKQAAAALEELGIK